MMRFPPVRLVFGPIPIPGLFSGQYLRTRVFLCCVLVSTSLPHSGDTELNRVCGTSRRVYRQLIVPGKLIWAWNWNQHPPRRALPDSRRVGLQKARLVCTGESLCLCASSATTKSHFGGILSSGRPPVAAGGEGEGGGHQLTQMRS